MTRETSQKRRFAADGGVAEDADRAQCPRCGSDQTSHEFTVGDMGLDALSCLDCDYGFWWDGEESIDPKIVRTDGGSVGPPSGDDLTTIATTECPVPYCPYVSVFEFDGDEYVGAREVAEHLNEFHEPSEVPQEDFDLEKWQERYLDTDRDQDDARTDGGTTPRDHGREYGRQQLADHRAAERRQYRRDGRLPNGRRL